MKSKAGSIASSLLALALVLSCGGASAKTFHGNYTVSYFTGPNHNEFGSECLIFTQIGNILGFPDSGTWRSSTEAEGGNFVVDQGSLRFYGTYNNGFDTINHYAPVPDKGSTGQFDSWFSGVAPLTPIQDGSIVMSHGCAGG